MASGERYVISHDETCFYVDDLSGKHRWAFTTNGHVEAEVSRRLMCEAFKDGWEEHRKCWEKESRSLYDQMKTLLNERDNLSAALEAKRGER